MAETIRVAELATHVSNDVFKFFKWQVCTENDQNFNCCVPSEHFPDIKKEGEAAETGDNQTIQNKSHPTDVVFYYLDPYLNKKVYFNTDLKSYANTSIGFGQVKKWLISIIKGTECAKGSTEWRQRYQVEGEYDIRGLLFVYNHDGKFDKSLYQYIHDYSEKEPASIEGKKTNNKFYIKDLNIPPNMKVHIVEPKLISYMQSIKHDCTELFGLDKIPKNDKLNFFYPNRQINKVSLPSHECAASIELLSGPYLIISFENFNVYKQHNVGNEIETETIKNNRGHVVYYREKGASPEEFLYLLETLMTFELINENSTLLIRHISEEPSTNATQNFKSAVDKYGDLWRYSSGMRAVLNKIEFGAATIVQRVFLTKQLDRTPNKAE
jgi:hypothetical protein